MSARVRQPLLLAPFVVTLLALFALPQLVMLEASLGRRSTYGGIVHEWSLANYARAMDPLYLAILARSVILAAATTAVCLLIGFPVAYWLARRVPPRWRSALVVLMVLPFWTSFLVRMYAWVFLLRTEGLLPSLLQAAGLPAPDILYTDAAVLLGQVYGELPFMILPLFASLESLDPRLLDAAADLGASTRARLWRVVVPLAMPGIAAGALLVFVPSLGAYLAPDLLGGARTAYVGNLVQSQFAVARDVPFGAALSLILSVLVLAVVLVFRSPLPAAATGEGDRS